MELHAPQAAPAAQPAVVGIVNYLRERRLQPGDRPPSERNFAERLGIGRNAVREALATLVALRVVDSRPSSGIYLRHVARESSFEALVMLAGMGEAPTSQEVSETMEVRVLNAFYQFTAGRRAVLFDHREQAQACAREHGRLIEHIRTRDRAAAQRLILDHMDRAAGFWYAALADHNDRTVPPSPMKAPAMPQTIRRRRSHAPVQHSGLEL